MMGFIDPMRSEGHAVKSIVRVPREQVVKIDARAYRAWRQGRRSPRTVTDAMVVDAVGDTAWRTEVLPEGATTRVCDLLDPTELVLVSTGRSISSEQRREQRDLFDLLDRELDLGDGLWPERRAQEELGSARTLEDPKRVASPVLVVGVRAVAKR